MVGILLGMAVDSTGNVVVIGHTRSATFPLKNAFESNYDSEYGTGFVTKLSSDARSLVYSTYYGGSVEEFNGAVKLVRKEMPIWQVRPGRRTSQRSKPFRRLSRGNFDWYVGKFSPSGTLIFSTYLGGSGTEYSQGIALAPDGSVFIIGRSPSSDFPLKNPIQSEPGPRASAGSQHLRWRESPEMGKHCFTRLLSVVRSTAVRLALFLIPLEIFISVAVSLDRV